MIEVSKQDLDFLLEPYTEKYLVEAKVDLTDRVITGQGVFSYSGSTYLTNNFKTDYLTAIDSLLFFNQLLGVTMAVALREGVKDMKKLSFEESKYLLYKNLALAAYEKIVFHNFISFDNYKDCSGSGIRIPGSISLKKLIRNRGLNLIMIDVYYRLGEQTSHAGDVIVGFSEMIRSGSETSFLQ